MALPTREDFAALLAELKDMNVKVGRLVELQSGGGGNDAGHAE